MSVIKCSTKSVETLSDVVLAGSWREGPLGP